MRRFEIIGYAFDEKSCNATFSYKGKDGVIFKEKVFFDSRRIVAYNKEALDRALVFATMVLGTSYYKAEPTRDVESFVKLDDFGVEFFNQVYQEGLSQFAYENHLTRDDLAHFVANGDSSGAVNTMVNDETLVLLSGGKDSLLLAEKFLQSGKKFSTLYISSNGKYPEIVGAFGEPFLIRRMIDKESLVRAGGLNGHVPVTLINEALALVQAILSGFSMVQLGLGEEGVEPHAHIGDLAVNHQWSKTPVAQKMLREYVVRNITESVKIGSILEKYSELEIAEQFAELCWDKFGDKFSSCNVANYKQDIDNQHLKWCGKCPKCANSYLLFAPFVPFEKQLEIFGRDLFSDPELVETFKGLLGVDGVMKPFECVGSVKELRKAYHERLPGYGELPFNVPKD